MRWLASAACAVTAVLLVSTPGGAQVRPDFSGTWSIDAAGPQTAAGRQGQARGGGRGRGGPSGDMGSGWGSTITLSQDAATLTVEYAFFSRGDLQAPLKFVYAFDGSETSNSVMMGRGIQGETSRTSWDGPALVIVTTSTFPDPDTNQPIPVELTRRLSLEDGSTLVVETVRSGVLGGPPSTSTTVYTR